MDFASYRKAGLLAVAKAGGLALSEEAQNNIYNDAYLAATRKQFSGGTGLRKKKLSKTRKNKRKCKH